MPLMYLVSGRQLQAMLGGMSVVPGQGLSDGSGIPHRNCVVDGVGVDGNAPCKMWGWYWDGPSPHSAHYGETVGKWNAWDGDGKPFQPSPYGTTGPYYDV